MRFRTSSSRVGASIREVASIGQRQQLNRKHRGSTCVIRIGIVHFIQYCVLTVLLCKIFTKRQYAAILLALLAGFLDEVYQAYPIEPLNWRDIMLNVTGVIWGWLMFWTLQDVKKD